MDLLLEKYLHKYYPHLPGPDQDNFQALLEETDLDIYDWITARSKPEKPAYLPLIKQLQSLQAKINT